MRALSFEYDPFQKTVSKVLVVVEKEYKTGNLDHLGMWPWGILPSGKEWPLRKWVRVNTISPSKATSSLLKKAYLGSAPVHSSGTTP